MKIGGEYRPEYIRGRHLERLATDLGMRPRPLRRRAAAFLERIEQAIEPATEQLAPALAGRPVLERIRKQIRIGLDQGRAAILEA